MTRRTWVWIVVGAIALLMAGCFTVVGTGIFLVSRQTKITHPDARSAELEFESVRSRFKGQPPLLVQGRKFDIAGDALRRRAAEYSGPPCQTLHVMVWADKDERLVKVDVPIWLLGFGTGGMLQFDDVKFDRLHLDPKDLQAAGPLLLLDEHTGNARVVLWTE